MKVSMKDLRVLLSSSVWPMIFSMTEIKCLMKSVSALGSAFRGSAREFRLSNSYLSWILFYRGMFFTTMFW